jgi:hypothetical protein
MEKTPKEESKGSGKGSLEIAEGCENTGCQSCLSQRKTKATDARRG